MPFLPFVVCDFFRTHTGERGEVYAWVPPLRTTWGPCPADGRRSRRQAVPGLFGMPRTMPRRCAELPQDAPEGKGIGHSIKPAT